MNNQHVAEGVYLRLANTSIRL